MSKMFQGYGVGMPLIPILPPPLAFENAPTANQTNYEIGQVVYTPPKAPTAFYMYAGEGVWAQLASSTGNIDTINGDAGSITGPIVTLSGGTTGLTTSGSATTMNLTGTLNVANGGTSLATLTSHALYVGNGTSAPTALALGTSGQYLVSGGASANPSFQTATPQLIVTTVAGTTQAMTSNHSYIANNASQTVFTLPTTSAVGDILQVVGSALNTGGWEITYTTGQLIYGPAGHSTATTGNAASGAAAAQSVTMVCVVANTTWVITANSGTVTLT